MIKTTYERFRPKLPKLRTYRSYKHPWNDSLVNKFKSEAYAIQSGDIRSLKSEICNYKKFKLKQIVRGNNKPHITFLISKEIMTRSRLKNETNKSGKEDLKAYKKQGNLVLKLNRKAKKNFLKSCISTKDKMKNKIFWKLCKPFFTEKDSQYDQNITLTEKNAQYLKNTKLQIFSTNISLISQRHWTYQNGNHKKDLSSKI